MLKLLNKVNNAINGNYKPSDLQQCNLDSGYHSFLQCTKDREAIDDFFISLIEFQKNVKQIPVGRTFTINLMDNTEIKLLSTKEGFVKAD